MTDAVSRTMAETQRTLERMWRRRDRKGKGLWGHLQAILQQLYDPSTGGVQPTSLPYATPAITHGTAAAAGSAASVIRSNATIVTFDATAPADLGAAAATGAAAVAARRDHVHLDPTVAHAAAVDPHAGYVKESEFNAKGDLLVGTADNTLSALTVGANGQIPYGDSTQATGIRWGAPPSSGGETQGTYLVSGGQVTWQTGLTFAVAAGTGYINGVLYSWAAQTVTLDAADATHPRIDVIYVADTAVADSITGTPSADPSEPVADPGTQLKLALVTIAAGATAPTVSSELVYAENAGDPTEWDWTTSGSGWTLNSTNNPRGGTIDIEGTTVAANAYVEGERGSGTIDPTSYAQLVLYLRFKTAWGNNRFLQITLRNAGVQVGNALRVSSGFFGLDQTNITTYQAVIIPTLQFAAAPGAVVNQVRIQALGTGGTAIGVYLDDISFTTGGTTPVGGAGLSQDEADARYLRRANNLSDVASAATARTNLGIVQGHVIQDEGTPLTHRSNLNFVGAGVTATDDFGNDRTIVTISGGSATDEKAKVSANDTTAGYLNGKLVAGTNITLTENNDGSNETLTIAASGAASRWEILTDGSLDGFIWAEDGGVYSLIYAEVP
jgi:hypothetical protein